MLSELRPAPLDLSKVFYDSPSQTSAHTSRQNSRENSPAPSEHSQASEYDTDTDTVYEFAGDEIAPARTEGYQEIHSPRAYLPDFTGLDASALFTDDEESHNDNSESRNCEETHYDNGTGTSTAAPSEQPLSEVNNYPELLQNMSAPGQGSSEYSQTSTNFQSLYEEYGYDAPLATLPEGIDYSQTGMHSLLGPTPFLGEFNYNHSYPPSAPLLQVMVTTYSSTLITVRSGNTSPYLYEAGALTQAPITWQPAYINSQGDTSYSWDVPAPAGQVQHTVSCPPEVYHDHPSHSVTITEDDGSQNVHTGSEVLETFNQAVNTALKRKASSDAEGAKGKVPRTVEL